MLDRFKRNISYLRISVTDRCNFRCIYCMPAEGVPLKKHEDIMSFDEIVEVVSNWPRYAKNAEVKASQIQAIGNTHRLL